MKTAAYWELKHKHALTPWLSAHGLILIRGAVIIALCGCAGLLSWQLLSPLLHHAPVESQRAETSFQSSAAVPRAALVARIQERHLFGDSTPAAEAPVLASSGSVSVIGIVYSSEAQESVALLSVAGNTVVSHVGTQLPTGQTVAGIQADRVQLSGGTGTVNLLLDIPKADPDQRFSPGEYATAMGAGGTSVDPAFDGPAPSSPGMGVGALPPAPVGLAPTHFVSLRSLRGPHAAQRFGGMELPATNGKPQH